MSFQHVFVEMHRREEERGFCKKKIKKVRFTLDKPQDDVLPFVIPLTDLKWDSGLSTKMNEASGWKQKQQGYAGLAGTVRKTGIIALKRNNRGCTLPGPQEATFSSYLLAQQSQLKNKRGGRGNATQNISIISGIKFFLDPIVCKP